MGLCKKVQAEEYVIHVVESTDCYTHLRFSLLASPWFLRPLGLALWGVLHMLLVGCIALTLLAFLSVVFAVAFSHDALMLCVSSFLLLGLYFVTFLPNCIASALVWTLLLICCTIPVRLTDQGLGHYILSVGGLLSLSPQNPRPPGPSLVAISPREALQAFRRNAWTVRLVTRGMGECFPFWKGALENLSREIVPWYDTVVI